MYGGGRPTNVIIRPYFLPDSRHFLHYGGATQEAGIYVASLDGKESKRLLAADSDGLYAAASAQEPNKGWLLFLRGAVLLAQAFDAEQLTLTGEPFPLADQVEPAAFPFPTQASSSMGRGTLTKTSNSVGWIGWETARVSSASQALLSFPRFP
jgi:hypothetical protein